MNPSHAREDQSDRTINKLIRASEDHGYAGWIMLNLYPERSPKPSAPSAFDPALSAASVIEITHILQRFDVTEVLGFENTGVALGEHGQVQVDEYCRAAENVWAIGDVTGTMPFTHVAKYQGRIAADAILGKPHAASYGGIPRVVFGDPEIAATGLTKEQADQHGVRTVTTEFDLASAIARPWTYEQDPRGFLGLLADTDSKTLIGARAIGPMAGEWIHHAALAIRTQIPIEILRDQVAQFPTYNEAYQAALEELDI